jgi:hypothetical protein
LRASTPECRCPTGIPTVDNSRCPQPFATTRLEFAFRELAILIGGGLLEVGDEGLGVCCRKRVAGRRGFAPNLPALFRCQNGLYLGLGFMRLS